MKMLIPMEQRCFFLTSHCGNERVHQGDSFGSLLCQTIPSASHLSKQIIEIIVRPNPKPMDFFTIPATNGAIFY
jgi:hypothetical protein